jgi:hypothetical protein
VGAWAIAACVKPNDSFDEPEGVGSTSVGESASDTSPDTNHETMDETGTSTTTMTTDPTTAEEECSDRYEDNDVEDDPFGLPGLTSPGSAFFEDAMLVQGDADWFHFHGNAVEAGSVRAVVELADVEVCLFAECDEGETLIDGECSEDGDKAMTEGGRIGCCGNGIARFAFNCVENPTAAIVYVRLRTESAACIEYGLEYGI